MGKLKNMAVAFSAVTAAVLLGTTALAASQPGGNASGAASGNVTSSVSSKSAPDTSSKGGRGAIDFSNMTAEQKAKLREILSKKLADLVSTGKMSKEKADSILAGFDSGKLAAFPHKDGKRGPVDLSKLTAEQKAELRAKIAAKLSDKVTKGAITQAEADRILADFDKGIFTPPHMTKGGHGQHKANDTQSSASKAG